MSCSRVRWEDSEKRQLKRLFRSHPVKPVSYLENLFNAGKPQHERRSHNAVKYRVRILKKEWYRRWLEEKNGIPSTAPALSATSLFSDKYAWSAPDMGIYIPLHPLWKDLQFSPSIMYPEDGPLPAFEKAEKTMGLARKERQEGDEEAFRRDMISLEIRSSSPEVGI